MCSFLLVFLYFCVMFYAASCVLSNNNNCVHRVHPNKSPLTIILEKREREHIQELLKIFGTPIISGTGKTVNFKFCTHIHMIDRNKSPLQILGKVAVGVVRDSRKFSGHRVHRAVIFATSLYWFQTMRNHCVRHKTFFQYLLGDRQRLNIDKQSTPNI